MGIFSAIKGLLPIISDSRVKDDFQVEPITSGQMDAWIYECADIYQGNPCWIDEEDGIDTVNFAKSLCSEIARLTMQGTSIKLSGSARADWIQEQIDRVYSCMQSWVEYQEQGLLACRYPGAASAGADGGRPVRLYAGLGRGRRQAAGRGERRVCPAGDPGHRERPHHRRYLRQ